MSESSNIYALITFCPDARGYCALGGRINHCRGWCWCQCDRHTWWPCQGGENDWPFLPSLHLLEGCSAAEGIKMIRLVGMEIRSFTYALHLGLPRLGHTARCRHTCADLWSFVSFLHHLTTLGFVASRHHGHYHDRGPPTKPLGVLWMFAIALNDANWVWFLVEVAASRCPRRSGRCRSSCWRHQWTSHVRNSRTQILSSRTTAQKKGTKLCSKHEASQIEVRS